MEYTPRKHSLLNSTIMNNSQSPAELTIDSQKKKRFSRSKSNSHSKSKDQSKAGIQPHSGPFFVKNICKEMLNNKVQHSQILNRVSISNDGQKPKIKRQSTPSKQRRQIQKPPQSQQNFEESLQNQLNFLKMQRQLKQALSEKQRLQTENKNYDQKVTFLSLQLAETINQNKFLKQKIKYLEQREVNVKDAKMNSANRIKKMIVENKELDKPETDHLQQRIRALAAENSQMKESMKVAEHNFKQLQQSFQVLANQRELFLDQLVQQLKIQLAQKENTIKKLMIQLNIFLVREFQRGQKGEQQKTEELQNLKKKYVRILKKYHEISQELAAFKRKNERMASLFPENPQMQSRKSSVDSLSFSP